MGRPSKESLVGGHGTPKALSTPGENSSRCGRLRAELSVEFFTEHDTNGRTLALGRSFWTNKNPFIGVIKIFLYVFTVSVYFNGVALSPEPQFFLAYLTNWSLTYAFMYQTFSLLNTWLFDSLLVIKISWAMFSVAAVHQIVVSIFYWFAIHDDTVDKLTYFTIMSHGGVCVAVLFEGLIVNRVPVRLKHFAFVFALAILYLIWTLIQNLVIEYNPYSEDDDVALYDSFAWKRDAKGAALFSMLLIFVVLPITQLWLWAASLMGRRYREEDAKVEQPYAQFSRALDVRPSTQPKKKRTVMAEI